MPSLQYFTNPTFSILPPLFDPLIQRLQNPCIYRRDHVHGSIQFFLGHPRFPCVRKAPIHSRITEPHHRDREANEHLFALGEAFDSVRVAIKSPEICLFHCFNSFRLA
jgi:hypothetical protein